MGLRNLIGYVFSDLEFYEIALTVGVVTLSMLVSFLSSQAIVAATLYALSPPLGVSIYDSISLEETLAGILSKAPTVYYNYFLEEAGYAVVVLSLSSMLAAYPVMSRFRDSLPQIMVRESLSPSRVLAWYVLLALVPPMPVFVAGLAPLIVSASQNFIVDSIYYAVAILVCAPLSSVVSAAAIYYVAGRIDVSIIVPLAVVGFTYIASLPLNLLIACYAMMALSSLSFTSLAVARRWARL